jgi:hypothetical protein
MKVAPARTRATRWGAFTARQRSCAASISLNAMASPAAREPGHLVTLVRCRTVAKVDSIERTFGETRRRVKVIGRLPGEISCLTLVWAVLDRASRGWRGFTMTAAGLRQLQDLRRSLLEPPAQLRPRTVTAA